MSQEIEHGIRQIPIEEVAESLNLLILFCRQNPDWSQYESSLLDMERWLPDELRAGIKDEE